MAKGFFKGGFLAHPPGMGKTMSVLCAAFEHLRQLGTACEIRTFILYVTAEKCLSAVYNEVQCNVKVSAVFFCPLILVFVLFLFLL